MTFFSQFKRKFARQPIRLRMVLAGESVLVGFHRGDLTLDYQALVNDSIGKQLPVQVLSYLSKNAGSTTGQYPIPYRDAVQLLRGLKRYAADSIVFDCEAVEKLRVVARPAAFALHWDYDPSQHALIRRLSGADRSLGKGWYAQGDAVWPLSENVPEAILKWLNKPSLSDSYVVRFVTEIIPYCAKLGIPVHCSLRVVDEITLHLHVLTARKSLLRIALESSHPELTTTLTSLNGDDKHMISGNTILLNLRALLSEPLLKTLQAGEMTLMGEQIPIFIEDELRPRAKFLHADMAEMDRLYPIISADQLKLTWQLEQSVTCGIGGYRAVANIICDGEHMPLSGFQTIAANQRFYSLSEKWIEFTSGFREKLRVAIQNGLTSLSLTPSELLGGSRERLLRLHLTPPSLPSIRIDKSTTIQEQRAQALTLLAAMRSWGLPVGISGLQVNLPPILAEMSLSLLSEYSDFKLLWITSRKRKESIQRTLLEATKTYNGAVQATAVSILSPDQLDREIAENDWTLVIFHDLDQIMPSTNFARVYQLIRRLWTVATFTNSRWHENASLQDRVLQALRLTGENASAFFTICHHSFSEQQESLITRIASPFKRLLIDSPDDIHSAPIPPRTSPSLPTSKSPGDRFVQEAQQLVERTAQPTEPVPFMRYYPTYSAMSQEQLRWYLYWRDQFRRGNSISTDLSYLFVHIYEALNLVGFSNAQAAFDRLVALWTHYRALQPKLDRYLVDWLADFIIIHKLPIDPLDWYARVLLMGNSSGDPDLAFTAWVYGHDYSTFPLDLLFRIIHYSPKNGKFYSNNNRSGAIDSAFVKGIRVIDEWLRQTNNRGLFEYDEHSVAEVVTRPPFAGALHSYGNSPIRIAEVRRWSQMILLANDLTGTLKYVENILREQAEFGSKLRGITISQTWKDVLDQAFGVVHRATISTKKRGRPSKKQLMEAGAAIVNERQTITYEDISAPSSSVGDASVFPAQPEINIDLNVLARLAQETEEIRARLIVDDTPDVTDDEQHLAKPDTPLEAASPVLPASYTERPPNAPPGLLTDLPEVAAAMGASDDIGAKLLRHLREHGWQAEPAFLEAVIEDGFLSTQLDAINERAFEQFNDALLFLEDGLWVVAEDYRDEIGYILDHPAYGMLHTEPASPRLNAEQRGADYADLSEEWALFAQQLQPQHWEAIAALLSHIDVAVRLDAIARSAYTTSNLLVDTINDAAMDTVGDIVIDTMSNPPRIEDEDLEALTQMLTWANANRLLEL